MCFNLKNEPKVMLPLFEEDGFVAEKLSLSVFMKFLVLV